MEYSGNEIAIVGIALRLPGSNTIDDFWNNLKNGSEAIRELSEEELVASSIPKEQILSENYVGVVSACEDYDKFDAAFFGYTEKEARLMNPQHRLFLETCWNALEHAGYDPLNMNKPVGVFGAEAYNTYIIDGLEKNENFIADNGFHDVMVGNDKDYLATRVSYKLNLTGPSITVQTACSSSLGAVHYASQSLLLGECDYCLAGGVSVSVSNLFGYEYKQGFINSKDGHCKPFDNDASGTVFGTGVGVVVLKRLEDAINDRDTIYSIIKSSAVNNDGNRKIGFTAPSQEGQTEALSRTLEIEEIDPLTISYIEAHGTGTALGDPIEISAIKEVYGTANTQNSTVLKCGIGAVKSNLGHLDVASGIVGLIKTTLCLYNKKIVPTVNYKTLNNKINLKGTRFYIVDKYQEWKDFGKVRRAAVSAFGVGGTNVHILLEEAPKEENVPFLESMEIIKLSAKSINSIEKITEETIQVVNRKTEELANIIYTLNSGRSNFEYRRYLLLKKVKNNDAIVSFCSPIYTCNGKEITECIFFFGNKREYRYEDFIILYNDDALFRTKVDECLLIVNAKLDTFSKKLLYSKSSFEDVLNSSWELMSFIIDFSFVEMIKEYGILPDKVFAKGSGKYVASCVTGIVNFTDALSILVLKTSYNNLGTRYSIDQFLESIHINSAIYPCYVEKKGVYSESFIVCASDFWLEKNDDTCDISYEEFLDNSDCAIAVVFGRSISVQKKINYSGTWIKTDIEDTEEKNIIKAKFDCIGQYWSNNLGDINWKQLYKEKNRKNVQAPLYYFDRKRYWHNSDNELGNYIWKNSWEARNVEVQECNIDVVIILGGAGELAEKLTNWYAKHDIRVIGISSDEILILNNHKWIINDTRLRQILEGIFRINYKIISVIDLLQFSVMSERETEVVEAYYSKYYYIISLCNELSNILTRGQEVKFTVIGSKVFQVKKNDKILPSTGLLMGPILSIPLELTNFKMQIVDYDNSGSDDILINQIARDCVQNTGDNQISYRDGVRHIIIPSCTSSLDKKVIKDGGIYIITGGTGNVGLLCAEQIAKRAKTKIYLISRSYDKKILYSERNNKKVKGISSKINQIKEYGSIIEIKQGNVADYNCLKTIVSSITEKEQHIDGVIHAAGKVGNASAFVKDMTLDNAESYFDAKINGAINLAKIFEDIQLDFCIMISSNVATLGGIGDSAYSSANAFLKSLCYSLDKKQYLNWLSVDFDSLPRAFEEEFLHRGIKFGAENYERGSNFGKSLFKNQLTIEEFGKIFELILCNLSEKSIVISKTHYINRLQKQVLLTKTENNIISKQNILEEESLQDKIAMVWNKVIGQTVQNYDDNFFDIGGDSYLAIQLNSALNKEFACSLNVKDIFEYSTIKLLADRIRNLTDIEEKVIEKPKMQINAENKDGDIAVIGISGRFPGANNIDELWSNLLKRKISISHFNNKPDFENMLLQNNSKYNTYIGARGILDNIDKFDYTFFKISKTEAEFMDPQQRLFLQCCWEAINDAGYQPSTINYKVGVFGSTCISSYLIHNIIDNGYLQNDPNNLAIVGNSPDALATRVSYKFNFDGPSKAIQSFCSSSLAALQDAINSIRNNECQVAIAGGVNIVTPQKSGYMYNESSIFSETGNIRPFDDSADGTIFSNGIGVVLLKRYSQAIKDKDPIYGIIKAANINNDGSEKVGYLSPSIKGHANCIIDTYIQAKINPETISYVETHATGTKIGDPIEVEAYKKAYQTFTERKKFCCMGTIKGNIGHLDRASGIVGLIKCLMIINNRKIPPLAYFNELNKEIDFSESPFYLAEKTIEYTKKEPMRAALSSLGVGGTNIHVVVEENISKEVITNNRNVHIIIISAKSEESFKAICKDLFVKITNMDRKKTLAQIAYSLHRRNDNYNIRYAFAVSTEEELRKGLLNPQSSLITTKYKKVIIHIPELFFSSKEIFRYYCQVESTFIDNIKLKWRMNTDSSVIESATELQNFNELFFEAFQGYFEKIFSKKINLEIKYLETILNQEITEEDKNCLHIHMSNVSSDLLYKLIGKIWEAGIDINWNQFNYGNEVNVIHLPPYHFIGERCWLDDNKTNKRHNAKGFKLIENQICRLKHEMISQLDNVKLD